MSCACKLLPIHRLEVKARRAVRNSSNYITLTFREVLHMPIAEILAFPGENLALLHKNFSPKKSKNRLLAPHGSSAQTRGIPKLIVINIAIPRFAKGRSEAYRGIRHDHDRDHDPDRPPRSPPRPLLNDSWVDP